MELATAFDLAPLPLILAGPILRRTEADQLSVWVALKAAADIDLHVFAAAGEAVDQTQSILRGRASTVEIGQSLHLALITARPQTTDQRLMPGKLYAYDLKFYPKSKSTYKVSTDDVNNKALNELAIPLTQA